MDGFTSEVALHTSSVASHFRGYGARRLAQYASGALAPASPPPPSTLGVPTAACDHRARRAVSTARSY
jgi:hypothetical protein